MASYAHCHEIGLEHFLLCTDKRLQFILMDFADMVEFFNRVIKRQKFLYSGAKFGSGSYAQKFKIVNDTGYRKVTDVNVGDVQHTTDSKQLRMCNELNIIHELIQHNLQSVQLCNNKIVPTKLKNKVSQACKVSEQSSGKLLFLICRH